MKRTLMLAVTIAAGLALNGAAFAGPTITDKRYWPNEAQANTATKAFASGNQAGQSQSKATKVCRYQGGPKSNLVAC